MAANPLYNLLLTVDGAKTLTGKAVGQMPDGPITAAVVNANLEPVACELRGWKITRAANGFPRVLADFWVILTPPPATGALVDNVALFQGAELRALIALDPAVVVNEETKAQAIPVQISVGPNREGGN